MKDEVRAGLERAALAYFAAKPWSTLRDEHFFGLKDVETGLEGWVSVAGNAGEEFGAGIYMGKDGRRVLEKVLSLDLDIDKQNEAADVVALAVAEDAEAAQFRSGTRLETKADVAGKQVFPIVFRKPPGESARALRDREATFLTRVLAAIVKTREWGLGPDDVEDEVGGRLVLTLDGALGNLEVHRSFDVPMAAGGLVVPGELATRLQEAPRTKRLLVGFQEGKLVLFDPKAAKLLAEEKLAQDHPAVAARRLVEWLAGAGPVDAMLPREIWTDAPSLEAVAKPLLEPFGIKVAAKLELKELKKR